MNPITSPDTILIRSPTLRAARVLALIVSGALIGLALDLARLRGLMPAGIAVALAAAATVLLAICLARVLPTSHPDREADGAETRHAAGGDPD